MRVTAFKFQALFLLLLILFVVNIGMGSVYIPAMDIVATLFGNAPTYVIDIILNDFRIPKAFTAVIAGVGIATSGLLMQTFFRNPLAGPYVLGVSSGASLGAAVVILLGASIPVVVSSSWGLVVAALLGSGAVLLLMLWFSQRVSHSVTLLIVGLMLASFASAMVSVLQYFSSAEEIQSFLFWSFGSLGGNDAGSLLLLGTAVAVGLLLSGLYHKELNVWITGEMYARSMGVPTQRLRWIVIVAACLLAGSVTAFCGPIAFVGLAVPHVARMIFKTASHGVLIAACSILGAIFLLLCDIICQLPPNQAIIPINAVTSLVGAPIVISIIMKKRRQLW